MTQQYLRYQPNWPLFASPTNSGVARRVTTDWKEEYWNNCEGGLKTEQPSLAETLRTFPVFRIIIGLNSWLSTKHTWTRRIWKSTREVGNSDHKRWTKYGVSFLFKTIILRDIHFEWRKQVHSLSSVGLLRANERRTRNYEYFHLLKHPIDILLDNLTIFGHCVFNLSRPPTANIALLDHWAGVTYIRLVSTSFRLIKCG